MSETRGAAASDDPSDAPQHAANPTRKTCGEILPGLAERGLAEYDGRRKRNGAGITAAGLALLDTERSLTTRK